eukprot:CAMPEP_0182600602 /NCGR_PEP_ID=MMETSP1324-20130603/91065_1 /TAXON_ID=236786 /ORGANISM="Florenciella sp., Strain RCC1587" /LENGTH=64 /DNA_ID=CAMNT_0024818509 /DNA_START=1176 /DNA_END=1370 /DNA_ORIENTATION=+
MGPATRLVGLASHRGARSPLSDLKSGCMVVGHGGMAVVGRARRMCAGAVLAGFSRAIRGRDGQS